jgi:3-phytase
MLGSGVFQYQPEGIVIISCPDGNGYYICVDQDVTDNTFQIFDRATLEHLGAFSGAVTANTDGIAVTQYAFGDFPEGIFVAVNSDGGVGVFDWKSVADRLKLKHRCGDASEALAQP